MGVEQVLIFVNKKETADKLFEYLKPKRYGQPSSMETSTVEDVQGHLLFSNLKNLKYS